MTPIEAINNVAKAYQDLAVVLLAVADKTVGVPAGQAMKVDSEEAPGSKENKTEEKQAAKDTKSVKKVSRLSRYVQLWRKRARPDLLLK